MLRALCQSTAIRLLLPHFLQAYHPVANGMVERLHRRLKETLLACSHVHPSEWFWKLPSVMLSLRMTLKPDLGAQPAELLFGEPLSIPGSLLSFSRRDAAATATFHSHQSSTRSRSTAADSHLRLPQELQTCTHVFVRKGGDSLRFYPKQTIFQDFSPRQGRRIGGAGQA